MNSKHRFINQSFFLIWLNSNDRQSEDYYRNALKEIELIVNKTIIFTDPDKCVDFLTDIIDEKVFLVIATDTSQQLIPLIHDVVQLYSIYVLMDDAAEHQFWTDQFRKVRCMARSIKSICELLQHDTKKSDYDFTSISIIPSDRCGTKDLNELPPSFMYSQILKEILSDIGDHQNAKEDLVHFWYQKYVDCGSQLENIDEFDRTYRPDLAIRWYSRETFVYSILNQALRTLDVDIMIKMGFLLRDLDQQIKELYEEQSANRVRRTVYRGQAVNKDDFEKLRQSQNGLLSFNNFLSTSNNSNVSKMFCPIPSQDPSTTAALFKIDIDPAITSAPFALLTEQETNFSDEDEILFSMHSVFRIGEVVEIEKNLWQVALTLTSNSDGELIELTDCIREEIKGGTGWHRLGLLLIKIGNFDKAEEIYQILYKQTPQTDSKTCSALLHQFGLIDHHKGNFQKALQLYNRRLEIEEQNPFSNPPDLAITYCNAASVHQSMGNYSEALKFYEKTIEIEEKQLSPDSPELATTYSNIGLVHKNNGNFGDAIRMYEKALAIGEKSLPPFHPSLVPICNNIASVYCQLEEYSNAFKFYRKALEIEKKSLPANHPYLALTYSAIGALYKKVEDYDTALTFYQKALQIYQLSSQADHPNLASIYNNIASLHVSKEEYSKAFDFYDRTLGIEIKYYGPYHPEVARTYNNIAEVYINQEEYQRALELYEKTQKIYDEHLPSDHLDYATLYSNIGVAHVCLQHYAQAFPFFKRALPIFRRSLRPGDRRIIACEENVALYKIP